jgi:disulfide bond formation protein DsbB
LDLYLGARHPLLRHLRTANLAGGLWCAGLVAYALFVQYGLHEEPCPLCILQRVAVLAVGVVFLAAALHAPSRDGWRRMYAVLIVLTALAGIAIAGRHVWILAQPAGSVAECGASLDYMMDVLPLHEVLGKVLSGSGECAKVTWRFLGISMPAWVLANLAGLAVLGVLANGRSGRRR